MLAECFNNWWWMCGCGTLQRVVGIEKKRILMKNLEFTKSIFMCMISFDHHKIPKGYIIDDIFTIIKMRENKWLLKMPELYVELLLALSGLTPNPGLLKIFFFFFLLVQLTDNVVYIWGTPIGLILSCIALWLLTTSWALETIPRGYWVNSKVTFWFT